MNRVRHSSSVTFETKSSYCRTFKIIKTWIFLYFQKLPLYNLAKHPVHNNGFGFALYSPPNAFNIFKEWIIVDIFKLIKLLFDFTLIKSVKLIVVRV